MTDGGEPGSSYDVTAVPRCYRHPDRETYIACQRCGRPICPDCMRAASVGFHCPECVKQGAAGQRQARTMFGGRIGEGNAVTVALIAVNLAVFLIGLLTNGIGGSVVPRLGLLPDDRSYAPAVEVVGVAQGGYWELVSSTFLHTQPLHLLFNMVGLWIFGSYLESQLGRLKYLGLYLLTGLVGSVFVYLFAAANSFSLGASGSIFGLFAAALLLLLRQKRDVTQLLLLLAFNLAITFTVPSISWQAHLGGLLSGLALGGVIAYAPRKQRQVFTLLAGGMLLVLCVAAVVIRTGQITSAPPL